MSTRYVWEKYGISFKTPTWKTKGGSSIGSNVSPFVGFYAVSDYSRMLRNVKNAYGQDELTAVFIPSDGSDKVFAPSAGTLSCAKYPYLIDLWSGIGYGMDIYRAPDNAATWSFRKEGVLNYVKPLSSAGDDLTRSAQFASSSGNVSNDIEKGTVSYGEASSSGSGGYPSGVSTQKHDYWYEYLGSDSIDPASVSITGKPRAGEAVTVSVTPGSGKVYGGTVSYQYQYSVNNGSAWTDIETTAATSAAFVVPAGAKTIRFRARAMDDMGFTSADYVTTASAEVERLNLWVGAGGKARKGTELYVGVNGKARKVTAAYVGVNGKARRFL